MSSRATTVYEAKASTSLQAIKSGMFYDIAKSRELIWAFFVRNFAAKYKQSMLGYVWAIGPPIITIGIFTILARNRVIAVGDTGMPYPAFMMLGLTVWGLFSSALMNITTSLASASSIIQKMNFPRETLIFASFVEALFDTGIRALLLIPTFIWYGVSIKWTIIFVPVILLPLVLLTLGAGFMLAILNAIMRNIASGVTLVIQFFMFLTPVVYPAPKTWPLSLLNYLNPLNAFLVAVQDMLTRGSLSMPLPLVTSSVLSIAVFIIGWRVFMMAQPIIGERI